MMGRRVGARVGRLAAAALLAAGAAACDGVPTDVDLGQRAGGGERQAESRLDTRLVGTWTRIVFFGGGGGNTVTNETRFTFRGDGRFVRRQVTSDFTTGFGDEVVAQGTWRTQDGTLLLDFESPTLTGVQLPYQLQETIDGTRLFLDGLLYVPIATGP